MPTGTPEDPNAKIYKLVKSGFLNSSTSKLLPHGKYFNSTGAFSTNFDNSSDSFLFTTDTNPSNSALTLRGSR